MIGDDSNSGSGSDPRTSLNQDSDEFKSGISVRHAASKGVLRSMDSLNSPEAVSVSQGPLFDDLSRERETGGGLAPSLDHGLNQAHRFSLVGRIFRPITDFIRNAFSGSFLGGKDGDSEKMRSKGS